MVDTSIALKWFAPEDDSALADNLLGRGLTAPDLLVAELGNALWKKRRRQEIGYDQVPAALESISSMVSLVSFAPLWPRAMEIAFEIDHAVYDCFYLAMAQEVGAPLVTADKKFVDRCRESPHASSIMTLSEVANG